jgi:DNA-directed RNA polymerase subunit N (RpoN/RPB10)
MGPVFEHDGFRLHGEVIYAVSCAIPHACSVSPSSDAKAHLCSCSHIIARRETLDALKLNRYCCRRMLLTHVDLIEKLLNYNSTAPLLACLAATRSADRDISAYVQPTFVRTTETLIGSSGSRYTCGWARRHANASTG